MSIAVPNQRTWLVADIVTAAEMNANVRDAVDFLSGVPLFVGAQSATQSVPNASYTPVNLDTSTVDTYSGHSTVTNNSRYTAQQPGWHFGIASWGFTIGAAYRLGGYWQSTGSTPNGPSVFTSGSANGITSMTTWILAYLTLGQYLQCLAYQNSGAAQNIGNVLAGVWWMHS